MIQLNKSIRLGQHVTVPEHLSWQTDEARISGEYVVFEIKDDDFYDGIVVLSKANGEMIEATPATVAYLTGTKVLNPSMWDVIDPDRFQPERSDYHKEDYFTEEDEGFGFWYCGWRGNRRTLDSSMVPCRWCYGKMPW